MKNQQNDYDAQRALIMDDNVNVGSPDDGKDFLILIGWLFALIIVIIFFFNSIAILK